MANTLFNGKMLLRRGAVSVANFIGIRMQVTYQTTESSAQPVMHIGHHMNLPIQAPIGVARTPLPMVATPANKILPGWASPVFPADLKMLPVPDGYAEAHRRYTEHKLYLQKAAYAMGAKAEVAPVNFHLKTWIPGRKTATPIAVSNTMMK